MATLHLSESYGDLKIMTVQETPGYCEMVITIGMRNKIEEKIDKYIYRVRTRVVNPAGSYHQITSEFWNNHIYI